MRKQNFFEGYFKVNVQVLDILLPEGIPRNAFVTFEGEPGTGKGLIIREIAYKAVKRGENVVFVCIEDTPVSYIQKFSSMMWNVLPYIEKGLLVFIDCFSFQLRKRFEKSVIHKCISQINYSEKIKNKIVQVDDPRNIEKILYEIESMCEGKEMLGKGLVVIDSLTELMSYLNKDILMHNLKLLRARICKERCIPVFSTLELGMYNEFRNALEGLSDGIIDLRFDPGAMNLGILIRQVRVRRMGGVSHKPYWLTVEIKKGEGVVFSRDSLKKMKEELSELMGK